MSAASRQSRLSESDSNECFDLLVGKHNLNAPLPAESKSAGSWVVSEDKSKDKEFLALYRSTKRDAEKTKQVTALEEYWGNTARRNYAKAVELARQAAALAK